MNEYDEVLYSRQILVFGAEPSLRLAESRILIVGLKGVGSEVAKNLALSGCSFLALWDDGIVDCEDLNTNLFLLPQDIGAKTRSNATKDALLRLGSSTVILDVVDGNLQQKEPLFFKAFTVVVSSCQSLENNIWLDGICHKSSIGFVLADALGVLGMVYCDFGLQYSSTLPGPFFSGFILNIAQGPETIITAKIEDGVMVPNSSEFLVKCSYVGGMLELNDISHIRCDVVSRSDRIVTLRLWQDSISFSKFTTGGYIHQLAIPKTYDFRPLSEAICAPTFTYVPFWDDETSQLLHLCYFSILEFSQKIGTFPSTNPQKEDISNNIRKQAEVLQVNYNSKVVEKILQVINTQMVPLASIIGGIAAQEIMKFCTKTFIPIHQFLYYDASSAVSNSLEVEHKEHLPYQADIIGYDTQCKLQNEKYFLIGVGAIGCELLKNWAMMGVATGPEGMITVADNDTIEKSNLSRQFLFSYSDINKSKARVAAEKLKQINPDVNITPHFCRVSLETQSIFDDLFYEHQNALFLAVDNLEARLFIDNQCVFYNKPLLEAGTEGAYGTTTLSIPGTTVSYISKGVPSSDTSQSSIPVCTIKNFPYQPSHTISWAVEVFKSLFETGPTTFNRFVMSEDQNHFLQESFNTQLCSILSLYMNTVTNYTDCLVWYQRQFHDLFQLSIISLLKEHPPDSLDTNGELFWKGERLCPNIIPLYSSDHKDIYIEFFLSSIQLYALLFGLQVHLSAEEILNFLKSKPKEMHILEETDDQIISAIKANRFTPLRPLEFDKDNALHLAFVHSAGTLRSLNYSIPPIPKVEARRIAGRIIPALITTTAIVAGLICLEHLKILQGRNVLEIQEYNFNLSSMFWNSTCPMVAKKIHINDQLQLCVWDRFEVNGEKVQNMTLLIQWFKTNFDVEVLFVSAHGKELYSSYSQSLVSLTNSSIIDIWKQKELPPILPTTKYLMLEINSVELMNLAWTTKVAYRLS